MNSHKAATETATRIQKVVSEKDQAFKAQRSALMDSIESSLTRTSWGLWGSTALMVVP